MKRYLKIGDHVIGKKHLQALPFWLPSAVSYGAIGIVGLIWLLDFDPVLKKVPFVRRRFQYPYEDDKRVYVEPVYDL
ncbi:hypothetical protein V9T40_011048 [Parthenolecanium corni]|uniref:Uncharacterized protein n=1 Tax=Parthenolecanium corni TaxID=536013 RepID=A0AAN9T4P7_9HEMI